MFKMLIRNTPSSSFMCFICSLVCVQHFVSVINTFEIVEFSVLQTNIKITRPDLYIYTFIFTTTSNRMSSTVT